MSATDRAAVNKHIDDMYNLLKPYTNKSIFKFRKYIVQQTLQYFKCAVEDGQIVEYPIQDVQGQSIEMLMIMIYPHLLMTDKFQSAWQLGQFNGMDRLKEIFCKIYGIMYNSIIAPSL